MALEQHRLGSWAGLVGLISLSTLLLFTGATIEDSERELFALTYDARWLYVAAGVLGLACVFVRRLLPWWALAMTVPTLGRAVTLLVDGSPSLTRSWELRGAATWLVLWIMGGLCVIVLEGSASIRRYVAGR